MTHKTISYYERHFLGCEAILAVVATVAFGIWCEALSGLDSIGGWTDGSRTVIYATVASVGGVMLGFTISAVSVLIGYVSSDRFQIVRDAGQVESIWTIFFQAIWAFGGSTILALFGLVVDPSGLADRMIMYANVGAFAFAVLRGVREVWVLRLAVKILTRDAVPKSQ